MRSGTASGLQIAFFTFAVLLLAVPITQWLGRVIAAPAEEQALLDKAIPFIVAAVILLGFPRLRRLCLELLAAPVPPGARLEVVVVAIAKLLFPFALAGGMVLWYWTVGGEEGPSQHFRGWKSDDKEMAGAFQAAQLIHTFMLAGLLGPVFEELVFRGLLYRAWERQVGWVGSMVLVSVLFALYHRSFWSAFLASIVFVCLYRRTGSLWAPIVVHALGNIALWYPLLGRHVVPRDLTTPADLSSWWPQLAFLVVAVFALPYYVWIARRKRQEPSAPVIAPNGALPQ